VSGRVLYHERIRDALIRAHREGPRTALDAADPAVAAAVHGGRVLPDARRDPVPRPAPARRGAGLRGPGDGRLLAAAGRARPGLADPDEAAASPRSATWAAATGCCCARRWRTRPSV
jgi:hypothetical protein